MYCPKCLYEYRDGFSSCPDCNEQLKHGSPPPKEKQRPTPTEHLGYENYIQAMDTPDYAFVTFVRSLLDAEEIDSYLLGEHVNTIYPMGLGIKLMVHEDQIEDAMEIIRHVDAKLAEPPSFSLDPITGEEIITAPNDKNDEDDGKGFYDDEDAQ